MKIPSVASLVCAAHGLVVVGAAGCTVGLALDERRCNVDGDCAAGDSCVLGFCEDRAGPRAPGLVDDDSEPVDEPPAAPPPPPEPNDPAPGDPSDPVAECAQAGGVFVGWTADDDGDGFTRDAFGCVSPGAPLPVSLPRQPAPVLLSDAQAYVLDQSFFAVDALPVGGRARAQFFPFAMQTSGKLLVTGFACAGAVASVDALVVRVQLDVGTAPPGSTALRVSVEHADAFGATLRTPERYFSPGLSSDGSVELSFPEAAGLFTPEQICDGLLAINFELAVSDAAPFMENGIVVDIDAVVSGADDCDDGDGARFSNVTQRFDVDGDGAAGGAAFAECIGADEHGELRLPPVSAGVVDNDCAPDDARAFRGQFEGFGEPVGGGAGGFDFNCDGFEEPTLYDELCSPVTGGCALQFVPHALDDACGALTTVSRCDVFMCTMSDVTTTQTCR